MGQWREALRISIVLYIVSSIIGVVLLVQALPNVSEEPNHWLIALSAIVSYFALVWIAIGWHRFILLSEAPQSLVPQFRSDRFLAYVGYSLLTGIIVGLVAIVGVALLTAISMATGSPFIAIAGGLVVAIPLFVIAYRLAPVLPGAALGHKTSIGRAWTSTRGAIGAFIVLAIISTIASVLIDLPANLLVKLPNGWHLSLLWTTMTGWIKVMVGVSIMTTIYGHYVEGRAIK